VGDTFFFKALNNLGAHAVVILLTLGQLLTVAMGIFWLGETPSAIRLGPASAPFWRVTVVMWSQISGPEGRTRLIGLVLRPVGGLRHVGVDHRRQGGIGDRRTAFRRP
jgi:hypothetical protein